MIQHYKYHLFLSIFLPISINTMKEFNKRARKNYTSLMQKKLDQLKKEKDPQIRARLQSNLQGELTETTNNYIKHQLSILEKQEREQPSPHLQLYKDLDRKYMEPRIRKDEIHIGQLLFNDVPERKKGCLSCFFSFLCCHR